MKKIILTFLVFLLPNISYGYNEIVFNDKKNKEEIVFDKKTKTIKELKQDLYEIDKKEEKIEDEIEYFIKNSKLKDYIKNDLTKIELEELEEIIYLYNLGKQNLEIEIRKKDKYLKNTEELNSNLLNNKIKLYKDITKFIKPEKYKLYLDYIKSDTKILIEKTKIEEEKIQKKGVIKEKVKILENKIKKHKKELNKDLKNLIEKKLEEKIFSLEKNPQFMALDYNQKILVISNTVKKTRNNLSNLKDNIGKTQEKIIFNESIKQKIELYELTIEKLIYFKEKIIKTRK